MLWASFFCTVDGLTTVYFINNEVDLAIMHQLQYQAIVTNNYMNASTIRSGAVNQGSVNYFLQFLQFSTSLSICSQVSWYHCSGCSPHCTIPSCQRQLLNLSNDSDNTHASNHSGRLIGLLERWIGKWSVVALSQDIGSSGLSSVSGVVITTLILCGSDSKPSAAAISSILMEQAFQRSTYSYSSSILTLPAGY